MEHQIRQLYLEGSHLWFAGETRAFSDADRQVLEGLIVGESRANSDDELINIGRKLFDWLETWTNKLHERSLTLEVIASDPSLLNAPWELLHNGSIFLVDKGLEVFRSETKHSGQNHSTPTAGLTLLLMSTDPQDQGTGVPSHPTLDERIVIAAIDGIRLRFCHEDTGTIMELNRYLDDLASEACYPVVHIACRGENTPPSLYLGGSQGKGQVSTGELLSPNGIAHRITKIPLIVLTTQGTMSWSALSRLAADLVSEGVRALLCVRENFAEELSRQFFGDFYRSLSEGTSLDRALCAARHRLKESSCRQWCGIRLFAATPFGKKAIATRTGALPAIGKVSRRLLGEGSKESLRLRSVEWREPSRTAAKFLEGGSFAGVIATGERDARRIVVARLAEMHRGPVALCEGSADLTAQGILLRVHGALGRERDEEAKRVRSELSRDPSKLQSALVSLLAPELGTSLFLVLDGIDDILISEGASTRVLSTYEDVLSAVISAFREMTLDGRMHRLAIMSRCVFVLRDASGVDLITESCWHASANRQPPVTARRPPDVERLISSLQSSAQVARTSGFHAEASRLDDMLQQFDKVPELSKVDRNGK